MTGSRAFGCFALTAAAAVIFIVLRTALSGGPILFGGAALFFGLLVTFVVRTFSRPGIVIAGDDGVAVESGRVRRFVSYDEIDRVIVDGARIGLVRTSGAIVQLHLAGIPAEGDALDSDLVRRIEECLEDGERAPAPDEDALARRGRAIDVWLQAIGARMSSKETYREPAFDRDALDRIVRDGRADPSARAAAAYALRALELTAEERETVRLAAESTAHPELRDAFAVLADPLAPDDVIPPAMAAVR